MVEKSLILERYVIQSAVCNYKALLSIYLEVAVRNFVAKLLETLLAKLTHTRLRRNTHKLISIGMT